MSPQADNLKLSPAAEGVCPLDRGALLDLLDRLDEPFFVKDRRHRWVWLNASACGVMGMRREDLLGRSDFDLFAPEQAQAFWDGDEEAFRLGRCENEEEITWQGRRHVISTTKYVWQAPDGEQLLVGTIRDITRRVEAERKAVEAADRLEQHVAERTQQLQESNRRLQDEMQRREQAELRHRYLAAIVEAADDIAVIKDLDLRVIATNNAYVRATGHRCVEDLIGKTDAEIFGLSPDCEPVRGYMADELAAQRLEPGQTITREEVVHYADGSVHTVLTHKFPVHDASGRLIATANFSSDITQRIQAEREADRARRELDEALEAERKRLAGDLHDSIGQQLVALQLVLQQLGDVDDLDTLRRQLRQASQQCARTVRDIRGVCHRLYPPALATLGLAAALRQMATEFGQGQNIVVHADQRAAREVTSAAAQIGLFRIAQEALTNAARHAAATRVTVELVLADGMVMLEIADDGAGFDAAGCAGIGLNQMRSRAAQIGARFDIDSAGSGTVVRVWLPLADQSSSMPSR